MTNKVRQPTLNPQQREVLSLNGKVGMHNVNAIPNANEESFSLERLPNTRD